MSYKFEEGKDLIIDSVIAKIKKKMDPDQALLCSEFIYQFYSTVALEDLQEWEIDDLYGAGINLWALVQHRAPKETKIRIYNPEFERNGWQTTHTVVEIIIEDMPFLVDSLRMVFNRMNLVAHLAIHTGGIAIKRDEKDDKLVDILAKGSKKTDAGVIIESPILMIIDRITDSHILNKLYQTLERTLQETRAVFEDWGRMREKVREAITELHVGGSTEENAEIEESKAFLHWIEDDHFTFLGLRDYALITQDGEKILQPLPESGLGVLRASLSKSSAKSIASMTPEARELVLSSRSLVMFKTSKEATIHRQTYTDYIGVKRFNKGGQLIGERRIVGLYTSAAYNTNPVHIPFLRHKVALVMKNSNLDPNSHAGKVLFNILETFPRDDLIQGSEDELLEIAMGIYHMQERRRIRLFARTDVYRRFVSCLVYVPKDRFKSELRLAMENVLSTAFHSHKITFSTWFSESALARIHFIVRTDPTDTTVWDFKEIERKLAEVGRSWTDELLHYTTDIFGEEEGNRIFAKYKLAFPVNYCANFTPKTAVYDIKHLEAISEDNPLVINFYKPMDEGEDCFCLKIYQHDTTIPLSDVLPIIEHLGMRAISERPYVLKFENDKINYISEFSLSYTKHIGFEADEIKELFQNAFSNVWLECAENDGFNQLVLAAGVNWRQVAVLRAYARYFKQIGLTFSQDYIESALNTNPAIARKLVTLFEIRFNPQDNPNREATCQEIIQEIYKDLNEVSNLDEDKIIRQYIQVISATLRTNYYQVDDKGQPKASLSIKINSKQVPKLPKPSPMVEIFVYSPRVEGIHLRGGPVARGGIRWSDRREDFRTEILGLMKAQQVKNSVIVPSGAKGGFVLKRLASNSSREETLAEGIACYQEFIRSLLDITDNYDHEKVIKPKNVICFDGDDPYLVVAADKGTATFSDIANDISLEYNFWLGDAFASGGSLGYDHKKIGITARGAFESVKRHFYEMNIDISSHDFTVVGVGDMSGDVFGNGMLISQHIKLVAAFNHIHIFIDPNPDPLLSFNERQRLFHLPRSNWSDYDSGLISRGGGVFNRRAKSIPVSEEMKQLFGIMEDDIEPNELIRMILQAPVDLLWSAGIGTFVKAERETHADVGDRTNDEIRINGVQLRAKVVGEGGNLGLTQLARIEYSLNGGRVYTDFIDNSAGVSCSDREVNIKILLNKIVVSGDLTLKQRNQLLSEMTEEVAALVLRDNFIQPRAISVLFSQGLLAFELHSRYIHELERSGKLDREVEFISDDKVLMERKAMGLGLPRPSIAILLSYSKMILKEQILATNVLEDPYLNNLLVSYFPNPLQKRFSKEMHMHPLKREIIATKLSNIIVNEMGFAFVFRMQEETGAAISSILSAYIVARKVLEVDNILQQIEGLESLITAEKQIEWIMQYVRLLRRVTRWLLRSQRMRLNISKAIKAYAPGIKEFKAAMPEVFSENHKAIYDDLIHQYLALGISHDLAHEMTITRYLFSSMDIIEVSQQLNLNVADVGRVYFAIGEYLDLTWLRTQIIVHRSENNWESLSREALRDDLDLQQRQLTAGIINIDIQAKNYMHCFKNWLKNHAGLISRWRQLLSDLKTTPALNYTMFFVAIRELLDLTQTTIQMSEKEIV